MSLCSEGRESLQSGDFQVFKSPLAASQRRGRCVHQSEEAKLLGRGGEGEGAPNRCTEQTGRLQLDEDEVAHKNLISLAQVWLIFGGKLKSDWNLRANFYPKGLQDTKNTVISSRCQNTTYSPEKADPPGTQCTRSPWSSHFTRSYSQFWGVLTDQ